MKAKILSFILCLAVLAGTFALVFRFPDEAFSPPKTQEIPVTEPENKTGEGAEVAASSLNFVNETGHDAEDLLKELAYGESKQYENALADLVLRLDKSADYLKDEALDYYGATYYAKIADLFEDVLNTPFTDSENFGSRVSKLLTELSNARPDDQARTGTDVEYGYCPKFDTEPSGTTALAMLAIFRQQYQKSTGSVLLTFGGNALIGDTLLGAEEENSFKKQQEKSKYPYPFHKVSSILGTDSSSFINLAVPLTENIGGVDSAGAIKGVPAYASLLRKSSIEAVSISDPRILGFGSEGKQDTEKALKDAAVNFSDEGTICYQDTALGKVAYLTYHLIDEIQADANGAFVEAPKQDIAAAKAAGAKFVVVHFNWLTAEKNAWDPCMAQVLSTRAAVDNGANLVIGSHPDSIQAVEKYKDVAIIYSPGNLYKQGANATAFIFQQAFTLNEAGEAVPGTMLFIPVKADEAQGGAPTLALDSVSAQAFKNEVTSVSKTVKFGVGKKAAFTIEELGIISISK
ncbi:MAG: CapA family protein [Clostridia bacterium]|nr:CapA family protein [Clostridia bacterium]